MLGRGYRLGQDLGLGPPPPPPRGGWPPAGLPKPWGVNKFNDNFLVSVCLVEPRALAAVKADPLLAVNEEPGSLLHHVRCLGCNRWYSEGHRMLETHQDRIRGVMAAWDQIGDRLRASSQDPEAEFIRLHVQPNY